MWADGIHLKVRLGQDKVCLLVIVGVRADGTKELVAFDDGHRESTESWADLLRSCAPSTHPTSSPVVRAGAHFDKGRVVERPDDQPDHESGDDAQAA